MARGRKPKTDARRQLEQTKGDVYHKTKKDGSKPVDMKRDKLFKTVPAFTYDEDGVATKEWQAIQDTVSAEALVDMDQAALVEWCQGCALRAKAWKQVQVDGPVITDKKGIQKVNPWLTVMQRQSQIMLVLAARLGFDPGSRASLRVQDNQPRSRFGGLLKR